ncbi:MAG TPA: hypothetical protein PLN81_07870 [Bacillota bacterium]|nr:hypothetical protein [Bacillota bacterium]
MSEGDETNMQWNFIPLNKAERFDRVDVRTVERWKESELSGDEWRYSYVATLYQHGYAAAEVFGQSVKDVLLQAAATFELINTADDCDYYGYYGDLEKVCCQPGCENQWVYLKHPVEAFDKDGFQLCRNYSDGTAPGSWLDVRGFCEKHHRRGGAGLDDADINYKLVMVRI